MNEDEPVKASSIPNGAIGALSGLYYKIVGSKVFYWNEEWRLSNKAPDSIRGALKMKVKRRVSRYCIGY